MVHSSPCYEHVYSHKAAQKNKEQHKKNSNIQPNLHIDQTSYASYRHASSKENPTQYLSATATAQSQLQCKRCSPSLRSHSELSRRTRDSRTQ